MKIISLLIVVSAVTMIGCATDPLTAHKRNWEEVGRSISSYKPSLKECKKKHSQNMNDSFVIYTFNIKKDSADNILTFNDPYKLPGSFHKCVRQALTDVNFSLGKTEELRNGYLLINKEVEKFNYVIY